MQIRNDGGLYFIWQIDASNHMTCWTAAGLISIGGWHHIALTQTGTAFAKQYVDGVLYPNTTVETLVDGGGMARESLVTVFGRNGDDPANYADGILDDMRIYDRVLSAAEIAALAAAYEVSSSSSSSP